MRTKELAKVKFSVKREIPETAKKYKLRENFPLLSSLLHSYDTATADGVTVGLTGGLRDIFMHIKKGGFDMTPFKNRANWDKAMYEAEMVIADESSVIELLKSDDELGAILGPIMSQNVDIACGILVALLASDSVFNGRMKPMSIDQLIDNEDAEDEPDSEPLDIMEQLLMDDPQEFAADAPPAVDSQEESMSAGEPSDIKTMLRRISEIGGVNPKISYNSSSDRLEVSVDCGAEVSAGFMATLLSAFYDISTSTTIRHSNDGIVIIAAV